MKHTLRNAALKLGKVWESLTYILAEKVTYQHSYQSQNVILQYFSHKVFKNTHDKVFGVKSSDVCHSLWNVSKTTWTVEWTEG